MSHEQHTVIATTRNNNNKKCFKRILAQILTSVNSKMETCVCLKVGKIFTTILLIILLYILIQGKDLQ